MRYPVLLLAAVLLVAGCAAEEPTTYGTTTAGPTVRPKISAPEPEPSLPEIETSTERAGKPLCSMFSTAEISATLGLPVRKAVGDEGFAIGASVSGIPNWYATVVNAGVLIGSGCPARGARRVSAPSRPS